MEESKLSNFEMRQRDKHETSGLSRTLGRDGLHFEKQQLPLLFLNKEYVACANCTALGGCIAALNNKFSGGSLLLLEKR